MWVGVWKGGRIEGFVPIAGRRREDVRRARAKRTRGAKRRPACRGASVVSWSRNQESPVHFVTKILVVGCAVLSLLLSALTIAYSANAEVLRKSFVDERNQRISDQAKYQAAVAEAGLEKAQLQEEVRLSQSELRDRDRQITELQKERSTLRAEAEQVKSQLQAGQNKIDQLVATTDTQAKTIASYREETRDLRSELVKSTRQEIDLVDRINDLQSARENLDQTVRALREQLAEARLAFENASAGRTEGSSGTKPFEPKGQLIACRVAEVFTGVSGEPMAVISQGSNQGIRENMLLHIVRNGDTFVASIVITKVDAQQAVGRVETYARPVQVQAGDLVLSQL